MNHRTVQQWFAVDGDNTLRVNYKLDENSIVFDLGGYIGDWTDKIYSRYKSNIYVFEPVPFLVERLNEKFKQENIHVYDFGLSNKDEILKLTFSNDGSSFNIKGNTVIDAPVKSIVNFIKENKFKKIDLIKINIEGDEFPVLNTLIDNNMIEMFTDIQVQFHHFIPNAIEMRKELQEKLSKTHELTYNYEFVWENWTLKKK